MSKLVQNGSNLFSFTWNRADGGHQKRNSWHARQTFSYRIGVLFLNINCTPSSGPDAFCQEIPWHCGSHFDKLTQPVKKIINDEQEFWLIKYKRFKKLVWIQSHHLHNNENSNYWQQSLLEIIRQNIAGWCQQTFEHKKFVDNAQQCFAFKA